jgi:predicted DNA-binding protein
MSITADKIDTISIKLPHSINQILENIAQKEDRSKSSLIRKMISDVIEDYYDAIDGAEALKQFEKDGRETFTLSQIKEKYGI